MRSNTGTASFELEPPDEAEMAGACRPARRQISLSRGRDRRRVAGYAYAALYRTRPAYRFTVEDSIYIAPEMHRRGVGKALLVKLIEACTALGYRQMIAVIGDSDAGGVDRRAQGVRLRDVGNLQNVGCKFGRWLDTPMMQLALGPGATTRHPTPRAAGGEPDANLH